MRREKGPVSITIEISRERQAQILLAQRAARNAEKKLPLVQTAMMERVSSIFEGVDLSASGLHRQGALDIEIKDPVDESDDEKKATARINGMKVATLSIWKNPDATSFDVADERGRIYTLCGMLGDTRVELGYHTPSVDALTGDPYEAMFYGRIFRKDDTPVNRAQGRIIESPREILAIGQALFLPI